ncbi:MAG TPA: hypothetical protein VM286_07640 [Candidatus Thermoplasmatota archaeon]|nr:hypothetical protein [Candidatus Thermoplasmatota archaeon]
MTTPCRPLACLLAAFLLLMTAATASAQETTSPPQDPNAPPADPNGQPADPYATPTQDPGAQPATAAPCVEPGKNIQCNAFGSISMDTQRDIKGDPITETVSIWLNTNMQDQGARWLLFSVRNNTADGSNPVEIALVRFSTPNGDMVTTRVDRPGANEIDLWVDVLDTPAQTPITIEVQVGSSERGAYRLEALVLAFDRGYETLKDASGAEASLFASTLLGVNKESGKLAGAGGGSLLQGKKTATLAVPGFVAALSIALAVTLAVRRREA